MTHLTDAAQPTYENATARIEEIIRRLDSGEAGLRETLDLCSEGRTLIKYCTTELEAVGRGLQELRLEELVARLEAGGRGGSPGPAEPPGTSGAPGPADPPGTSGPPGATAGEPGTGAAGPAA